MSAGAGGLTRRLAVALVGTVAGLSALMAAITAVSYERIEHALLDSSLNQELDALVQWNVPPQDIRPRSASQQYFRPSLSAAWHLPPELAALEPGRYHDMPVADGRFHILVRDIGPQDRAYLLQDVALIEKRERQLSLALAGSVVLVAGLGLVLSRRIAAVTLRPLRELAQRVGSLDPERIGQRLEVTPRDADLQAVQDVLNAHMVARDAVVQRERAFAAAAAHELRTPVAVIRASIELAHTQAGIDAAQCAKALRAVDSLTALIDALLQLSLSRRGAAPQPVDLAAVLDEVCERHRDEAARLGVRIVRGGHATAAWAGSPGVATVIVSNLLLNALQAASGSADATVEIALGDEAVRISDTGAGLDPAVAARAFEPGVSGRSGGTGMGLYIARELARRHGGDVTLASRTEGPGTLAVWRRIR